MVLNWNSGRSQEGILNLVGVFLDLQENSEYGANLFDLLVILEAWNI